MEAQKGPQIMAHTQIRCSVCLLPQTHNSQNLLCVNCHKQKLETVKNSCIDNDTINHDNRQDINRIFEISDSIRKGKVPDQQIYPSQPMSHIKVLSLSLLKRELVNKSIRIRNIQRSADAYQQKVFQLNEQIMNREHEIPQLRSKLRTSFAKMSESYSRQIQATMQETVETKHNKIVQIQKQATQHQLNDFRVLKELSLHQKGYMSRKIVLFNQPVIDIDSFFEFNNKLFQLNGFLENLIRLQVHLVKVLDVKLPYLEELVSYLPDSEFYDLVQQKENFMINGGGGDLSQSGSEEDIKTIDVNDVDTSSEKVVKLGEKIKLPLSSKTINNQLRRASLARAYGISDSESPPSVSRSNSPQKESNKTSTTASPETQSAKRPSFKSNLTGKRVVIVPHKILTKPFTKLSSREYLKFLSIIVKMLVNFKVVLMLTIETLPKTSNISNAFTNTISHLRNSIVTEEKEGYINFTKVLGQVARIDEYFEHKLHSLSQRQASTPQDLSTKPSLNNLNTSNYSDPHVSKDLSAGSQSLTRSTSVIGSQELKELRSYDSKTSGKFSGLRNLYNMFKDPSPADKSEIYGVFSQTQSQPPNTIPSPKIADQDSFVTPKHDEHDLKSIMQAVNQLMLNGSNKSLNSSSNHNVAEAFNMMMESKSKLDDWDVVSKMYQ